MVFGNVMATDITFVPGDFTATDQKNYSLTKDGVTVAVTASTVNADQIRVFKGQTITISSAVGNITKAVFTCTAEGTEKYGPGCFDDATAGSYSYEGRTGTWIGDAAEFTLTAKTNQVRITSIVITVDGTAPTVLAPKFSVEGGMYFEPQTVALSCETEGAKILYTIPAGEDPVYTDENNYTGVFYDGNPLTISKTTTIKAMAVKDGKTSSIVTATYTIVNVENPGTEASPFTVADALALIDALANGASTTEKYFVKGVVVGTPSIQKKADGTFYGNANFDIAAEAGGTTKLTCYRLKGLDNAAIDSEDYIKEGDEVVVTGQLKKYVKDEEVTPEVVEGYIYSIKSGTTGINSVKAEQKNGAIYNVAGQMVTSSYKGLVIKNGKKMIQK